MTLKIDKTAMLLEGLGLAKTEAEELGLQLIGTFKRIHDAQQSLIEHGIFLTLNQITFDDAALQAAWLCYTKCTPPPVVKPFGPPMMETEEQIVTTLRSVT